MDFWLPSVVLVRGFVGVVTFGGDKARSREGRLWGIAALIERMREI